MVRTVKKPEDRKSDIVKVARDLFQTKEYDNVTMQDVMNSLNIAKGTIYHYFKSKEELFEAVIENIVDNKIEHMKNLMVNATGTALKRIQILITAGNISTQNPKILNALHSPINYTLHAQLLAATLVKLAPLYAQLIQEGCTEGIFKTDSPLESAEFILASIQFLTDLGIYPWTQEDLMRRTKAFPRLIETQLHAPRGSFEFIVEQIATNKN